MCPLQLYSARQKEEGICAGRRQCWSNYSRQSCSNFYSLEKPHWVWLADCAVVRNRPEWSYFLPCVIVKCPHVEEGLCMYPHFFFFEKLFRHKYNRVWNREHWQCGRIPRQGLGVELVGFILFPRIHRHKIIFRSVAPVLVKILAVFSNVSPNKLLNRWLQEKCVVQPFSFLCGE